MIAPALPRSFDSTTYSTLERVTQLRGIDVGKSRS